MNAGRTAEGGAVRPLARRGPSMADVAKLAGVSSQTVSRVANGSARVDEQTRLRVAEAMREVGYRPNGAARALRRGSFRTIGVVVFGLHSFGNSRTIEAVADAASDAGYSLTLISIAHPNPEQVSAAFSRLDEHAVDGILILIEAHLLDEARIVFPSGLPVVVLDSTGREDHTAFDADQAEGATAVTRHLLDLGHGTVHHLGGPALSYSARRREEAWRAELERRGAPVPDVRHGDWSADSGYRHGIDLVEDPAVTAVFAANDQMALGVLRAAHVRGVAVPARVSVAGFDDMDESANFWPPLTTVRQEFGELARRSVAALLAEIESGAVERGLHRVATRLIERESTAPPAG